MIKLNSTLKIYTLTLKGFCLKSLNSTLRNDKKGKQKMLWSREGAHNVLQIRAAQRSESWDKDWKSVEDMVYKLAA